MGTMPETSVTLLKALSEDSGSGRWTEFYAKYADSMRAFIASRFPSLEADDVMQETMLALSRSLSGYRYAPDENGHFRSYLMGIAKHKAMDEIAKRSRESSARERLAAEGHPDESADSKEEVEFRKAVLEVAIGQLMTDDSISPRMREVFRHVALMHEDAESVAMQFGITRNNVDQIKYRMTQRLGAIALGLSDI